MIVDVFLSRKSEDAPLAKQLYDFLTAKGVRVFDSDHSLQELGNADYSRAIDDALIGTKHLIVIGSSLDNISSPWVEAEWRFFLNRKRSGKVKGNILTVIGNGLKIDDLPPSLQNYEVISLEPRYYERIYAYVRPSEPLSDQPTKPIVAQEAAYLPTIPTILVTDDKQSTPATVESTKKREPVTQPIVPVPKPQVPEPVIFNPSEAVVGFKRKVATDTARKSTLEPAKKKQSASLLATSSPTAPETAVPVVERQQVNQPTPPSIAEFLENQVQAISPIDPDTDEDSVEVDEESVFPEQIQNPKLQQLLIISGVVVVTAILLGVGIIYDKPSNYEESPSKIWVAGEDTAQYNLGLMYYSGNGVRKSYGKALEWYSKAAMQGNPHAQYSLGKMYYSGDADNGNRYDFKATKWFSEAIKWYRKSAEQGNADSQYKLGAMYKYGHGVAQSDVEAIKWFFKSASQGNEDAQYTLGEMYEHGKGIPKDSVEAKRLYKLAAAQGHEWAKEAFKRLNDH